MKRLLVWMAVCLAAGLLWAETSEIRVDLKLDGHDFLSGERVRGVVEIVNASPRPVSVGYPKSRDSFFIEVFRASDMQELTESVRTPYVAPFRIDLSGKQRLEVFLGDHYALREPSRYLAKPVFVRKGVRYEGALRAFDIVEGVRIGGALQVFVRPANLRRTFDLRYWSRNNAEHLFLTARDEGAATRQWETRDLGPILRIDKPTISVLPSGEVVILHRLNTDQFLRTEYWSLPETLEYRVRDTIQDPETAGTARVRELYKDGGVKPKENPWWKFW